jgi:enamine deaminase RidA (YjgF/YER057c/UK114 family)
MRAMDDAQISARLSELGLELPPVPVPVAAYIPVTVAGELAFVAGQVPMQDGSVVHPGTLGESVSVQDAALAARQAALQALAALREGLGGSFERLRRIAQVTVYVAASPSFTEHPQVANGASELFVEVLGDPGQHARAAVGMSSLPLGTAVEVAMTAHVDPA